MLLTARYEMHRFLSSKLRQVTRTSVQVRMAATSTNEVKKSAWEQMLDKPGDKKFGAHNERNQDPIVEMLLKHLPIRANDE
eukprot:gene12317-3622_t